MDRKVYATSIHQRKVTVPFEFGIVYEYQSIRLQIAAIMSLATPRILPSHLHAFAPNTHPAISTVRMLGTITSLNGDQATLTSCNHETVTLILNRSVNVQPIEACSTDPCSDSHLSLNSLYEVVGKVINLEGGQGLGIRVLGASEWPKTESGQLPDLKLFEAVVDATHRYKGIFYEDDGEGSVQGGGY